MSIHKLIRQGRDRLGWFFFACTGNYLQVSMIVFLALLVFLAHNSPMPQTKRHRVSGSAVTTKFLKAEHTDFNKRSARVPGEPVCSGRESGDRWHGSGRWS